MGLAILRLLPSSDPAELGKRRKRTSSKQLAAAEQQQKIWATLVDLLRVIITLSSALLAAWAIIFSDEAKVPKGSLKYLIVAIVSSGSLSLMLGLIALIHVNRH